ncbi:MAG: hypothetical protein GF365_02390 [Candidatus Buchananbacteria bacterium]|nr:hypothetical protein [Candidatus Buchananbacteria bacterium]
MGDRVILWEGKEFPTDEAIEKIKRSLSFQSDPASNGNTMNNEVAITYDHRSGYWGVYQTTVYRDKSGTALNEGFVARPGFVN